MLNPAEVHRLVELQQRSYLLLQWIAQAVSDGLIHFEVAHKYSTLPEAAQEWILGHYMNIPDHARPSREDLPSFCHFFSTYLTNSFEFICNPGKQLYSPDAHCFCPMCSWLVDAPNLKTKKIGTADKRRAQTMRGNALLNLAAENRLPLGGDAVEKLLSDRPTYEEASLLAYGYDLFEREKGIANGPAVLALWRGFAWHASGSPKHGFRLSSQMIVDAEKRLLSVLQSVTQK